MEIALVILSGIAALVGVGTAIATRVRTSREKIVTIKFEGEEIVLTKDSSAMQPQRARKMLDEIAA
jgi:cysteine synthase